ncbi:deoxyhypusine synthase [Ignisphaera sp. 4213-co]|uniref:Probable deoxyhypusine synthase n=1 Tax=Ignisphaera cupida TaxID=3050454 RepID=A0ABD4Z3C2_9CREN|nr:deoxyhypusine synthase [Ignisphaera sp. 4213-co]MDK6027811.1 deoxyhypusine synthase [Ignisphaera sp. 4213-co]
MELHEVEEPFLLKDMKVEDLISIYGKIHGFMASHLFDAINIVKEVRDKCDIRIISFTGNIVATGARSIIAQLIKEKIFNVVITTCGAVDHDIAKSFGGKYLKGFFDADDVELYKKGMHRLGNVFIPVDSYGPLIEKVVHKFLHEIVSQYGLKAFGVREILYEIGKRIYDEKSILRNAALSNTPIYVPGFLDGAFGTALLTFSQFNKFNIDVFKDEKELADIVFHANCIGALIIGGGISKHHTLWWAQFHGGLDYAIYITTATEWDGSLSGARPKEAITWGKLKEKAKNVVVYADATLVLPIIAYAAIFLK